MVAVFTESELQDCVRPVATVVDIREDWWGGWEGVEVTERASVQHGDAGGDVQHFPL